MKSALICLICLLALTDVAAAEDSFEFSVVRRKFLKDEPGQLKISEAGVEFVSTDGDTSVRVRLEDIYEADVSQPYLIKIETYDIVKRELGGRREYEFRVLGGGYDQRLVQFFVSRLKRPVLATYGLRNAPEYSVRAYHRHVLGGCNGRIEFGPDGIQFHSEKPKDSRTWRYEDIETIGSGSPFDFRITTYTEQFTFDLKERLSEEAYKVAWQRVYRLPPKYGGNPDVGVNNE